MSTAPHTWPRLYLADDLRIESEIILSPDHTHYLLHVLRAQAGDSIRIFNGRDGEWRATLTQTPQKKKEGAILSIREQRRPQSAEPDVWLCCAPIKRNHFDYMIQKATELGASVIQPVLTSHTQVRESNVERLRTIAIEAAEQAERLSVPEIREPVSLATLVKNWPKNRLPIICAEFGDAQPAAQGLSSALAQARTAAAIFTGPEGGFTTDELALLHTLPEVLCLRLGCRILRADTAALAALSCWQALCGDWKTHQGDIRTPRDNGTAR
ncbi:MAG TPA: 16S rRNA (uracil(1498)-N(3))-methyltransferase [Rhodospirillaceae bacterium]|nr:16S rRNA (uracil(1498)-N(3))-methyltransferase [Rhodospirillaceae bacterium]